MQERGSEAMMQFASLPSGLRLDFPWPYRKVAIGSTPSNLIHLPEYNMYACSVMKTVTSSLSRFINLIGSLLYISGIEESKHLFREKAELKASIGKALEKFKIPISLLNKFILHVQIRRKHGKISLKNDQIPNDRQMDEDI